MNYSYSIVGVVFMSGELKNIIKVACIYATSIIGAGFASGQEIMQFFSVYRSGGFYGIALAGALFAITGSIVLVKVCNERIRNFEEFLFPVFGWRIGWVIDIAVIIFMLCLFCIMTAGSGSVMSDTLGIPFKFASLLTGVICTALIMTNIKGIVMFNTIVTPFLIAGIILTGFAIIFYGDAETFQAAGYFRRITDNWFFSSLLYVSYNSVLAIVVMCSLLPYLKTRRTAVAGGIAGGVMLCFAALVIHAAINLFYPLVFEKELPILTILKSFESRAGGVYSIILWLAMMTSAVTAGFCFAERISMKMKINSRIVTLVLCIAAVPLSTLGFSRLISAIYPVFGYLGLFMILVILAQSAVKLFGRYGGRK